MKTLKKSLSLVLVLTMVLSLFAMGASAGVEDFKDAKAITQVEAVEVMVALGVVEGMEDGNFEPNGKFTREQAAKILAYMLLGPANADAFATYANPFKDVNADRWSAGYIAYCASENIIAGYGDGNFGPSDELSSYAWAKMLLVALGYDPTIEELTGSQWQINTTKLALSSGLLRNADLIGTFNREMAVKFAFNCLTTTMVEYTNRGTTVIGPDGMVVIVGASIPTDIASNGNNYNGSASNTKSAQTLQFCERYFEDLVSDHRNDDLMRPGHEWKYEKKALGFYSDEAVLTYTAEIEGRNLFADLGRPSASAVTYEYYRNGAPLATVGATYELVAGGFNPIAGNDKKLGGNGILIEVYEQEKNSGDYTVVVIDTYVAEISRVNAARNDDARNVVLRLMPATTGVVAPASTFATNNTFETELFAVEDIVIFTYSEVTDEIQSVKLAEVESDVKVENAMRNATSILQNFRVDGTTYRMAANGGEAGTNNTVIRDNQVDMYFDEYGYVIWVDLYKAAAGNYAYVLEIGVNSGMFAGGTVFARIVDEEGVVKAVETEYYIDATVAAGSNDLWGTGPNGKAFLALDTGAVNAKGAFEGKVVQVRYSADGIAAFTVPAAADSGSATNAAVSVEKGKVHMSLSGTEHAADSTTVYVIQLSGNNRFNSYTGFRNVPTITGTADYAYASKDGIVKFVFIGNGASEVDSANSAFILHKNNAQVDSDNAVTANVVIGGDVVEARIAKAVWDDIGAEIGSANQYTITLTDGTTVRNFAIFKSIQRNNDNIITQGTAPAAADVIEFKGIANYTNSVVSFDTIVTAGVTRDAYAFADNAVVVFVDNAANIFDSYNVTKDEDAFVFAVLNSDGEIKEIYIFEDKA